MDVKINGNIVDITKTVIQKISGSLEDSKRISEEFRSQGTTSNLCGGPTIGWFVTVRRHRLTPLEHDVIRAMYDNEFNNSDPESDDKWDKYPSVWSASLLDNCYVAREAQISGVVSSLVQKGLVYSQGEGMERTVNVTELGDITYKLSPPTLA